LVEEVGPDIIHSHFVSTTLVMRLALGKHHSIPRVFQVPGPLHLENPLTARIELGLAGDSDYWIGTCKWTVDRYLQARIPKHRVFLSYYGTDLAPFANAARRGYLRTELGVDAATPLVGMVAFMYRPRAYLGHRRGIKGHEDLIDAMRFVRRRHPRALLIAVGAAWVGAETYENRVRRYAQDRLGKACLFLGNRSDVPAIYPDFDVAVHPSLSENVGGAGESLLEGVPTVATNVGGLPDVVRDGETGWLVPARDPVRLAAAIVAALDDPAEGRRRASVGRDLVKATFSVQKTAREVLGIYEGLVG
jgi:glycosyltransferase involved in cell wall biosynthesis